MKVKFLSLLLILGFLSGCGGINQQAIVTGEMDIVISDPNAAIGFQGLQDLQVTIEVRFITITDDFFDRIGVDFDFDLNETMVGSANTEDFGEIMVLLDTNQLSSGRAFKTGINGQSLGENTVDLNFDLMLNNQTFNYGTGLVGFTPILNLSDVITFVEILDRQNRTRTLSIPRITLDVQPVIDLIDFQPQIEINDF